MTSDYDTEQFNGSISQDLDNRDANGRASHIGGNTQSYKGSLQVYSLLHYASSGSDLEIFYFVLEQCKQLPEILLNAKNNTSESPLHFAVSANQIEIVRTLIDKIREINTQRNINRSNAQLNPSTLLQG